MKPLTTCRIFLYVSVKFKDNTQWYKFFHLATATATAVYSKNVAKNSIWTILYSKALNTGILDWYNYLWKTSSWKGTFPTTNCGNFSQNRTIITSSLEIQPTPSHNFWWLAKYLIHQLRNFKCIFVIWVFLYQLTSRQHFYFGRYSRQIPKTV